MSMKLAAFPRVDWRAISTAWNSLSIDAFRAVREVSWDVFVVVLGDDMPAPPQVL